MNSNDGQLNFLFKNFQDQGHPYALFGLKRLDTMIIDDFLLI